MKRKSCQILLCILLCMGLYVPATAQEIADFQGSWSDESGRELFFSLELFQDGTILTGYHCGTTQNASRVDCSMEGEDLTIAGTVTGQTANVKFTSAYSGQIGMAKLTREGDTLVWEITAFPNGEYYLPDNATLTRTTQTREVQLQSDSPLAQLQNLVARNVAIQAYRYEVKVDRQFVISDDFNQDGIQDIAAIVYPFDEHIQEMNSDVRSEDRFLAVGFADAAGNLTLALNVQAVPCLDCGGVYGEPELALHSGNGVISLSSYGGATWRWEETQKIRHEQGRFKVIGLTESSFHSASLARFDYDLNLNTLNGVRRYEFKEFKEETGEIWFKNFMAQKRSGQLSIDGKLDEPEWNEAQTFHVRTASDVVYKPENWNGLSDLSFSAATLWDEDFFYLGVAVTDENPLAVENWDTILQGDHLEVWFDFSNTLILAEDAFQLRQEPDASVLQIGIGLAETGTEPVIRFLHPDKPNQPYGILASSSLTANGYHIEAQMPVSVFQEFLGDEFQWAAGQNLGLTVVVSDADNPTKRGQDCLMATSQVAWGNPYTFGACHLVEDYEKPDFPVRGWRARY